MVGRTLSHYRILEKIGSGGMGEVYLAEDTKLDRKVALKVLPPELAESEERRARFTREAKAIAALNHPNIVTVYSVEEAEGVHFITMELVKGKTLTELLPKNGFPLSQFLELAIPFADAVAAAHQEGITHRDLKPDNAMVGEDGRVKVLDFGLAKPTAGFAGGGASELPTQAKTEEGAIVGTLNYMSPEQATGRTVDPRSDIFSLGIIFYEMLTGRRPFDGATSGDVLSSIVKDTPRAVDEVRPEVPREFSKIVRRCLAKEPTRRFQTALDVRNELLECREWEEKKPAERQSAPVNRWLAAALALSVSALIGMWIWPSPPRESTPRFVNARRLTSAVGVEDYPTWSPDGGRIAFQSEGDIWALQLGGGSPVNLTASPDSVERNPAWSPDGSQIAFRSDRDGGGLFVMSAVGGAPRKLLPFDRGPPVWSADGREIAGLSGPAARKTLEIHSLETQQTHQLELGKRCRGPSWSPDRRYMACVDRTAAEFADLWLFPLSGDDPVLVTKRARNPTWSADASRLFFVSDRGGSRDLWMLRLGRNGAPDDAPRALTTGLVVRRAAFSPDGTKLVYSRGRRLRQVWRAPLLAERPATWEHARQITFDYASAQLFDVSSEGRLVITSDRGGNQDLWIVPAQGGPMHQLTSHPSLDFVPVWSPDREWIAFASERSGSADLWIMPSAGGPARQLTSHPARDYMPTWSPAGDEIAFTSRRSGNPDIWIVSVEGGEPRQLTTDPAIDQFTTWSPDGKWLVFQSWRLRPEGTTFSLWRVPAAGGEPELLTRRERARPIAFAPRWSPDGRRLFFHCSVNELCELSPKDGEEQLVVDLAGRRGMLDRFSLAADGEFLYFSWEEDEGDLWVMDVVMDESE